MNKKRKQISSLEEEQNSLFKNKNFLEYQNRCLISLLQESKDQIEEKNKQIKSLEQTISTFSECFENLNFELYNLNEAIKIISEQFPSNTGTEKGKTYEMNFPLEILKSIRSNQAEGVFEKNKEIFTTISNNFTSLLNNLMNSIEKEDEIKRNIDEGFIKNIEKIKLDFSNEYVELKRKIKSHESELVSLKETNVRLSKENFEFNSKLSLLENTSNEKSRKIDELEKKYSNLNRKFNSNPYIPYIVLESENLANLLVEKRQITTHECICYICGESQKSQEPSKSNKNNNIESDKTQDVMMQLDPINNKDLTPSEREKALISENEALNKHRNELIAQLETKKQELLVSDERFLASKPYQILLSQAEAMMQHLEKLKEMNLELHKQKIEILNQREGEIKAFEIRENEKKIELEKKIEELTRQFEEEKSKNGSLQLRIDILKNELEKKNNSDFNSLFEYYETEKVKLNKNYENLKQNNSELLSKLNEESEKNENNEKLILKLNSEIDRLKLLLKGENIDPDNQNFPKFDVKEREEMKRQIKMKNEKITLLEKKNSKLKSDVQLEKENGEKLINELELNQKGFDDLSKKIKNLTFQIQETNVQIATLTKEKLKDNHTIKLLNDQRELMEKRLKEQEDLIENLNEYQKKFDNEIIILKECNGKLENEVKLRDEESELMKKEFSKLAKHLEEYKSSYEQSQKAVQCFKSDSIRNLTNYEQIRIKLDEVLKNRNNTSLTSKSVESMKEDNELLTFENEKFKKMVKCSVCHLRQKGVILLNCYHTFCKECITKTVESRNRACPICKKSFSKNDVKSFWWE